MAARTSLRAFLATARSALTDPPSNKQQLLTFVVGNESADLDSLCSALLLAYLRTYTPPHDLHIPLCHIPRENLTLRPEFTAVLKHASVTPDDVITLSELYNSNTPKAEDTQWLLVDHNSMSGKLGQLYSSRVAGCIDHHDDEERVPKESKVRVIEMSGSCMSLVVTHCRQAWDELSSSSDDAEADAQLANLALAPILIDTANLTDKSKTTNFDKDAVTYLEARLQCSEYERTNFYNHVSHLKEDISPLSLRDILRKDYKEWEDNGLKLGTSSVPQGFAFLLDKAGSDEELGEVFGKWGQEKNSDLVIIMTAFKKEDAFQRELLVWARSSRGTEAAKAFESDYGQKLGLSKWADGKLDVDEGDHWRRCWTQGKIENSRKQVAPMMRDAMRAQGK
ncbi:hypothetical protein BJ170DRAFT_730730 [Xylariales sp. AK1849]|nr:hypothetical protein BJ170DRAFT_730730 [Xylariales sp. AK1849]